MSYGQNPYGQNPYGGQPPQNPSGQRPYGGQPPQNPYGQPPQNPYGQPGQGRPQGPPNPYGQPQPNQPPPNPYGQPGGQNPYSRQPGQPQPNPYGQPPAPAQNPYAQQPDPAEAWRQNQPPAAPAAAAVTEIPSIASHAVPVHTLPEDLESFAIRSLGEVIGVALRPRSNDVAALTRVRQEAVSRMAEMAKAADADAVIGLRFDSAADEVVAYGTAVQLSNDLDYEVVDDFDTESGEDLAEDASRERRSDQETVDTASWADPETPPTDSAEDSKDAESTRISTSTAGAATGDLAGAESEGTGSVSSAGHAASEGDDRSGGYDFGQNPYGQTPYGQTPYGQASQGQSGQEQGTQDQTGQGRTGQGQGWPFSSGS